MNPGADMARFGPWLTAALVVLLATGIVMIIGEPARELLTLSFWLKMILRARHRCRAQAPSAAGRTGSRGRARRRPRSSSA